MKPKSFRKGVMLLVGIALLILVICVTGSFGFWLTVGLLSVGGISLLYWLISQIRNVMEKSHHGQYTAGSYLKFMATLMGFLLVGGTLFYLYVFFRIAQGGDPRLTHPVQFTNAEYLFRSLICALDLFMLDVDSNVLDRLDGHAAMKGWLVFHAALSFTCTVAMLLGLIYTRVHAYYKLHYATKITDATNHLYLFFGDNEPSELLIKDIVKLDPKAVAIIIDQANINEDAGDELEGIVGLVSHKKKVFRVAESIGAQVAVASQQLEEIDRQIVAGEDFDAFGYLGLSRIKKFIEKLSRTSRPQLHIFFMGENEEQNIRNIIALAKDTTIKDVAKSKDVYHRIYCHARYNGPNRVIQDVALKKHLNIRIVDSSHIAVELLKSDPDCHPVNVVRTDDGHPAAVQLPLSTMIIGFGEVGRDAFRFLYEFGAFVDARDYNKRSPFECVIVDKNLNDIQGTFMAAMPSVFTRSNQAIHFKQADYNSQSFYTDVLCHEQLLKEVNYIVISIDNDDEAIALAVRIFNHIRRVREDVSNLRIYVRCSRTSKVEGVQKIADHYNYGYGRGDDNVAVIRVFGQPEKTYTFDLVVSDRLIEDGKQFHEEYRRFSGEGDSWDDRHKQLTGDKTPNIEKLRKLRRQEAQDRANALHAATKLILLKRALGALYSVAESDVDWQDFFQRYFNSDDSANIQGSHSAIKYPRLTDKENEIILALARLEHLRWLAAHELMGYVFNPSGTGCDERTMSHNCLCPWDQLDIQSNMITDRMCDYKRYDFCVVDTTLALNKHSLLHPQPSHQLNK